LAARVPAFRLLLITDRKLAGRPLPEVVQEALSAVAPGSVAIQLREKDLDTRPLLDLASALLPLCRARNAPLLVNDRIDIALALGLDGVHLPHASFKANDARRQLGPEKLVGVSCHSVAEVQDAKARRASYATFGPLFDTPSKRAFGPPVGLEELGRASAVGLPLYGLGGVTSVTALQVRQHGAVGVAAIGAWLGAQDTGGAVQRLIATLPG